MKKAILIIILLAIAIIAIAQPKPDQVQTHTQQVLSNFSIKALKSLTIPHGTSPGWPGYVADTSKYGIYYNDADSSLYVYNHARGLWERQRSNITYAKAQRYADSLITDLLAGNRSFNKINANTLTVGSFAFVWHNQTALTKLPPGNWCFPVLNRGLGDTIKVVYVDSLGNYFNAGKLNRVNLVGVASTLGYIIYGDSLHDDRAALQAAINYCGTNKIPCYLPGGRYLLNNRLNLVSNLDLKCDGTLIRAWVGAEGELWSTIGQASYTAPLSNVTLDGLNVGLVDTTKIGRGMTLYCNNPVIKNIKIRFYVTGPGLAIAGNNVRIDNYDIRGISKYAGGGLRVYGGDGGLITNGYCATHDDLHQLVPGANDTMKLFNQSIKNFQYKNVNGISYGAKMIIASIDENNYCKIQNCSFEGVKGYTTSTAVPAIYLIDQSTDKATITTLSRTSNVMTATIPLTARSKQFFHVGETIVIGGSSNPVYNQNAVVLSTPTATTFTYSFSPRSGVDTSWSGGGAMAYRIDSSRVSHIQVSDFVGDLTGNTGGAAISLSRVSDVSLKSIQPRNYSKIGFLIADSCKKIDVSGLHMDAPLLNGYAAVSVYGGSSDIKFIDSFINGGSVDAFAIGSGTGALTANRVSVNNCTIGASAGNYGIHIINGTGNAATNNTILSLGTSTTSKGVGLNAASTGAAITGNTLDAVNTPVTDSGTGTVLLNNTPMSIPGAVTLASGTASVTVPGISTGTSVQCWLLTRAGTTTTTWQYIVTPTANTLTFKAITTAGATVTTDTSVLKYKVN